MHLPGIPDEDAPTLVAQMRRPEGTAKLGGTWPGISDPAGPEGTVVEAVAGAHVLRVTRDAEGLSAFHSSPGTGTRVATIPLAELPKSDSLDLWIPWSPESFRFIVVDRTNPVASASAEGCEAPIQLWVDALGDVVEVAATHGVMGLTVRAGGRELVSPPAIQLWTQCVTSTEVLMSGESTEGFIFEVAVASAALSGAVTGFETYCQKRFIEIELEGVPPDERKLVERFGSAEERSVLKEGVTPAVIADARAAGRSALTALVNRINFQNFTDCKRAYNCAYGLKFGEHLGLPSQHLERVRRLLKYRHRIIHGSPLLAFLNQPEVPPEEPEFANKEFIAGAVTTMDEFVRALHAATLRLRPK